VHGSGQILNATTEKNKFKKWGYTIPPCFISINRNEQCVLLYELQWHTYVYLYYSHVAESCKHLVVLHHPLCCATLTTVYITQYCLSLLSAWFQSVRKMLAYDIPILSVFSSPPLLFMNLVIFITLGMNILSLKYIQNCTVWAFLMLP